MCRIICILIHPKFSILFNVWQLHGKSHQTQQILIGLFRLLGPFSCQMHFNLIRVCIIVLLVSFFVLHWIVFLLSRDILLNRYIDFVLLNAHIERERKSEQIHTIRTTIIIMKRFNFISFVQVQQIHFSGNQV